MSQPDLGNKSLSTKQQQVQNKFFFRLPSSYISFFQAMGEDYYQRGKITSPSIALLAKTCLITAGNAWNRMVIQLINMEFERTRQQQIEQENREQQERYQSKRSEGYTSKHFAEQGDRGSPTFDL
jgi:hypothetical protein